MLADCHWWDDALRRSCDYSDDSILAEPLHLLSEVLGSLRSLKFSVEGLLEDRYEGRQEELGIFLKWLPQAGGVLILSPEVLTE